MLLREALKRQIDALREFENLQQQQQIAMQAANERRQAWLELTPGAKENPYAQPVASIMPH